MLCEISHYRNHLLSKEKSYCSSLVTYLEFHQIQFSRFPFSSRMTAYLLTIVRATTLIYITHIFLCNPHHFAIHYIVNIAQQHHVEEVLYCRSTTIITTGVLIQEKVNGITRYWLGQLDLNQRDEGVKVPCLTAWLYPSNTISFLSCHFQHQTL